MAIVKKQIKFDLSINGIKVKSLDDLRENITIEVIDLFKSSILIKWLKQRNEEQIINLLTSINQHQDDKLLFRGIVTAIGNIEVDDQIIDQLFKLPVKTNSTIMEAKQEMENIDIPDDNGQGVNEYKKQAFHWYKKAAEQGDSDAQFRVGVMYDNGQGVTEDKKQAFHWYKKAAEQGNVSAQFNLGSMYQNGEGVDEHKEAAEYWYREAYNAGHSRAGSILSKMSPGFLNFASIFNINNRRDK
jgi:hypothetical protein